MPSSTKALTKAPIRKYLIAASIESVDPSVEGGERVEAEREQLERDEDGQQLGGAQHEQQPGGAPEEQRVVLAGEEPFAPR